MIIRLICFDNPAASTQSLPFEERYESLLLNVPFSHPATVITIYYYLIIIYYYCFN